MHHTTIVQQQCTKWHDKFIKKKVFQKDDWALLYDSHFKDFKVKLHTRWMWPYRVETVFDNGSVELKTIDDEYTIVFSNGHRLRLYQNPLTKEDFLSHIVSSSDIRLIEEEGDPSPPLSSYLHLLNNISWLYINKQVLLFSFLLLLMYFQVCFFKK